MLKMETAAMNENEQPLVSVVITAYNRPDYLRDSLGSVLQQTMHPLEIIVVDDCSPADLQSVVQSFAEPIHYLRMIRNGGANKARNAGVRHAKGKYIAFLDDDDIWLPHKLERQLSRLDNAIACLCGFEVLDTGKVFVRSLSEATEALLRKGNPYCGMSGLVCERNWLLDNPLDESLDNGQDWDIFVRLAQQAPIPYVAEALFLYRRGRHASITSSIKAMGPGEMERRLKVTYKHRAWLGESCFRRRVALTILGYIGNRKQPWKLVLLAVRKSGVLATISVLSEKFGNFMKRGGRVTSH